MRALSDAEEFFIRTVTARAAKVNVSPDEKRLTGYPIVFNSLSEDLGGWKEIIEPSAVDRTLKSGANVDALVDHVRSATTVLGSTETGLMTLKKDRHGVYADIRPPDTTASRDVVTNVKAGLVNGMSFHFRVYRDPATGEPIGVRWDPEPNADGFFIRRVIDMEFDEVSVVLNPAYKQTEVSARAATYDVRALDEFKASREWKPSLTLRDRMIRAGMR